MNTTSVILQAKSLTKYYDTPARVDILDEVDFTLHRGETVAILGSSGVGKSTLLQILGTLQEANGGEIWLFGEKIQPAHHNRIRNESIGFVFQSFHLLEDFTAFENALLPAKIARLPLHEEKKRRDWVTHLFDRVGLRSRMNHHVKQLSGGEKQRVAIIRALCNGPPLLLCDEPSGNLDEKNSIAIQELLFTLSHEERRSLVVVTHDEKLAARCDSRYYLQDCLLRPPHSANNLI